MKDQPRPEESQPWKSETNSLNEPSTCGPLGKLPPGMWNEFLDQLFEATGLRQFQHLHPPKTPVSGVANPESTSPLPANSTPSPDGSVPPTRSSRPKMPLEKVSFEPPSEAEYPSHEAWLEATRCHCALCDESNWFKPIRIDSCYGIIEQTSSGAQTK